MASQQSVCRYDQTVSRCIKLEGKSPLSSGNELYPAPLPEVVRAAELHLPRQRNRSTPFPRVRRNHGDEVALVEPPDVFRHSLRLRPVVERVVRPQMHQLHVLPRKHRQNEAFFVPSVVDLDPVYLDDSIIWIMARHT